MKLDTYTGVIAITDIPLLTKASLYKDYLQEAHAETFKKLKETFGGQSKYGYSSSYNSTTSSLSRTNHAQVLSMARRAAPGLIAEVTLADDRAVEVAKETEAQFVASEEAKAKAWAEDRERKRKAWAADYEQRKAAHEKELAANMEYIAPELKEQYLRDRAFPVETFETSGKDIGTYTVKPFIAEEHYAIQKALIDAERKRENLEEYRQAIQFAEDMATVCEEAHQAWRLLQSKGNVEYVDNLRNRKKKAS